MRDDIAYLKDILDAISSIEDFIAGISEDEFLADKEKQYAVIRALEIIGKATRALSSELKTQYAHVPWRDIGGMRNKLIHMYFGVKTELVWQTAQKDISALKHEISGILDNLVK